MRTVVIIVCTLILSLMIFNQWSEEQDQLWHEKQMDIIEGEQR